MNYSTLKEAYSVDSFDKEKKKSKKSKAVRIEEFEDDSSDISQRDAKNIERALPPVQEYSRPSVQPVQNAQYTPAAQTQERQKILKGVQPHYDEELEKYLNINDFQSTNLHYYPQDYTQSYNNTNYSSPEQNNVNNRYEQDDRYQPKQLYYRPTSPAGQAATNEQYVERPVRSQPPPNFKSMEQRPRVTPQPPNGPNVAPHQQSTYQGNPLQHAPIMKTPEQTAAVQKDIFYKNMVNIGLFIFIGVLIIFLCDQITEIAINIGMKRTMMLLEPYMNMNKESRR